MANSSPPNLATVSRAVTQPRSRRAAVVRDVPADVDAGRVLLAIADVVGVELVQGLEAQHELAALGRRRSSRRGQQRKGQKSASQQSFDQGKLHADESF